MSTVGIHNLTQDERFKDVRLVLVADDRHERTINRVDQRGQLTVRVSRITAVDTARELCDRVDEYLTMLETFNHERNTVALGIKVVGGQLFLGHNIERPGDYIKDRREVAP